MRWKPTGIWRRRERVAAVDQTTPWPPCTPWTRCGAGRCRGPRDRLREAGSVRLEDVQLTASVSDLAVCRSGTAAKALHGYQVVRRLWPTNLASSLVVSRGNTAQAGRRPGEVAPPAPGRDARESCDRWHGWVVLEGRQARRMNTRTLATRRSPASTAGRRLKHCECGRVAPRPKADRACSDLARSGGSGTGALGLADALGKTQLTLPLEYPILAKLQNRSASWPVLLSVVGGGGRCSRRSAQPRTGCAGVGLRRSPAARRPDSPGTQPSSKRRP